MIIKTISRVVARAKAELDRAEQEFRDLPVEEIHAKAAERLAKANDMAQDLATVAEQEAKSAAQAATEAIQVAADNAKSLLGDGRDDDPEADSKAED